MKNLFQPLLLLIASATQKDLARQVRHLKVENEILRSKVPASHRLSAKVMNKFHVHIAASSQPQRMTAVCRGKILNNEPIVPAVEKQSFSVHGRPLSNDQ